MEETEQTSADATRLDDDVWAAISAFQQILQAIPNDRASLETLAHAFEQIGDHTQAREYVLRLGNVLVDEQDHEAATEFVAKLREYAGDDEDVDNLLAKVENLAAAAGGTKEAETSEAPRTGRKMRSSFNMAEELSCAWNLMQLGLLSEDEYSNVVQDLSDMSSQDSNVTVSVLHVLEGRQYKGLEKVINAMARECSTPYVSLLNFDVQHSAVTLLPFDYMVQRGVLVFDFIGEDGLVVVMNPYDKELQRDVQEQAGRPCHFFITLPSEFDRAIAKVSEMLMSGSGDEGDESEESEST